MSLVAFSLTSYDWIGNYNCQQKSPDGDTISTKKKKNSPAIFWAPGHLLLAYKTINLKSHIIKHLKSFLSCVALSSEL